MVTIPVIAYHKISNKVDFGVNAVKTATFKKHLDLLARHGYQPTTFQNIQKGEYVTDKSIVIVFDDGYEECYTNAAPIMKQYNFPAVICPVTNFIGKKNDWEPFFMQRKFHHLTKSQLIALYRQGFEIGSHGKNHLYLPFLNDAVLRAEILDSKRFLEELVDDEIVTFCYPYGQYNKHVMTQVYAAGYKYALGSPRLFTNHHTNYAITKQSIYATDTLSMFLKKIDNPRDYSWPVISQWLIQKGSFASIALNYFKNYKNLA
jgi:peptidoglycan/xylan/chitin deacetylase (PgdA/CDA1 family)